MPQLFTGLTSVTFRQLEPNEIISLTKQANLDSIEWGGDVHVPHGNIKRAKEVAIMTRNEGLSISSYGSYYHIGVSDSQGLPFQEVLDTACELAAPTLRVWTGTQGSKKVTESKKNWIYDETQKICEQVQAVDMSIGIEYRTKTLNDSIYSTLAFIDAVNHPSLKTYWQPQEKSTIHDCVEEVESLAHHIANIHVNSFDYRTGARQPLEENTELWSSCLNELLVSDNNHHLLIEFVKNKSPEQFLEDSKTLHRLLEELEMSL